MTTSRNNKSKINYKYRFACSYKYRKLQVYKTTSRNEIQVKMTTSRNNKVK